MKKILPIFIAVALSAGFVACSDDDDNIDLNDYTEWRTQNDEWVAEMMAKTNPDGTPYYTPLVPAWNPGAYVLIHYFNDRSETAGNLTPLYTSVVDVFYDGYDCEGELFDSSKGVTTYGIPGTQRFAINNTIQGWAIALEDMHVGDTCEVIVPYQVAYGTTYSSSIKPYSSLRFNIRLTDIYRYEGIPD